LLVTGVAFGSFFALGLPAGMLGVAWPSISSTFEVPLEFLGVILMTSMVGYLVTSFGGGRLVGSLGVAAVLAAGGLVRALGLLGFTLSPGWWPLVLASLVLGLGGGAVDAGLNIYSAEHFSPRRLTWLHASYGVGATVSPFIMATILGLGESWRWGYGILTGLQAVAAAGFLATPSRWSRPTPPMKACETPPPRARTRETLGMPLIWVGIAVFFVYCGVEEIAGSWTFSLFTKARHVGETAAGFWVGVYFGAFTAGRVFIGLAANRVSTRLLVRLSMFLAVAAAAIVWWSPVTEAGFWGLAVLGFALGPAFPLMISDTPRRVGPRHAAHAIGFQVASASLGAAVIPGLAGVLAAWFNLEAIGVCLTAVAVMLLLLYEVGERFARRGECCVKRQANVP
jgi:fucose permease